MRYVNIMKSYADEAGFFSVKFECPVKSTAIFEVGIKHSMHGLICDVIKYCAGSGDIDIIRVKIKY